MVATPFEYYDASGSAAPAHQSAASDVIRDLTRTGTEASLNRALDDINTLVAEMSAKDRTEKVPAELARLLEEITGADDAPLAWRSLHRRVRAGLTSWDGFWLDPTQEEDGMRLVTEVMRRSRGRLQEGLAEARDAPSGHFRP